MKEVRTVRKDGGLVINRVLYTHPNLSSHIGERVTITEGSRHDDYTIAEADNPTHIICYLRSSNRFDEVGKYHRDMHYLRELFCDLWDEYPDTIADATELLKSRFQKSL